jgi:hypothetical protein
MHKYRGVFRWNSRRGRRVIDDIAHYREVVCDVCGKTIYVPPGWELIDGTCPVHAIRVRP